MSSFRKRLLSSKDGSNKFEDQDEEEKRSKEKSDCLNASASMVSGKSKSSLKLAMESEFAAYTTTEIMNIKFKTWRKSIPDDEVWISQQQKQKKASLPQMASGTGYTRSQCEMEHEGNVEDFDLLTKLGEVGGGSSKCWFINDRSYGAISIFWERGSLSRQSRGVWVTTVMLLRSQSQIHHRGYRSMTWRLMTIETIRVLARAWWGKNFGHEMRKSVRNDQLEFGLISICVSRRNQEIQGKSHGWWQYKSRTWISWHKTLGIYACCFDDISLWFAMIDEVEWNVRNYGENASMTCPGNGKHPGCQAIPPVML